jgi:hypothetical protein
VIEFLSAEKRKPNFNQKRDIREIEKVRNLFMPDFKSFTDEEVRASYTLIQRLIYAYSRDKNTTAALEKIYKDLIAERTPRKIVESSENRNICGEIMTDRKRQLPPPKKSDSGTLTAVPNLSKFTSRLFSRTKNQHV